LTRTATPGPGSYNPSDSITKLNPGSVKIVGQGYEHSKNRGTLTPGPGSYDINSFIGVDTPAISIKGRGNETAREVSPGPGTYEVNENIANLKGSPGFKVGRSKRDFLSLNTTLPGPGQYDPQPIRSSIAVSLKGKLELPSKSDIPGPGTYQDIQPTASKRGNPTYSFGLSPDRDSVFKR
jgi:hypothetical protein